MRLATGARVGPYEIIAPLGAGGMGEVYRARDSRLGRDVAIKVLPAAFALEPEFQQRLQREARAISSLSHPHICPLYDVGHDAGVDYLVMEYLEGETLAARLARGPIPLDQALRHGTEIAAALAAAHRAGLVHRDLKPGNVMITRTGARLLDFGLAKPAGAEAAAAPDATVSAPITARGTLVGTFQYMSPEQVQGGEADARSDVFSFGAVLYEMITGTRAFDGKTTASVVAAVLEREPLPPSHVQPLAPVEFDDIVRGCLAKDPDERWQTAHDVRLQLEALRRRGAAAAAAGRRRVGPVAVIAGLLGAAVIVAAALAGTWYLDRAASPSLPLVTASLLPPAAHAFTPNDFAISPDGKRLAFVAFGDDGVSTLWVSSIQSGHPQEIAGSDGAVSPFWSPDSRWVGFFAQGRLMKVEPGGIGLQAICSTRPLAGGGAWSGDEVILFANDVLGPLWSVPAAGGTPSPVTKVPPDVRGEAHRFPQFLPDGKRFLYTASWTDARRGGLYLGAIDGQAPVLVSAEIQSRAVLAGDRLLYVKGETLYSAPFDTTAGTLAGAGRVLLRNEVVSDWRFGEVPLSASANGVLVYQSPGQTELILHDRSGKALAVVGRRGFSAPALSADGRYAAVTYDAKHTGQTAVWIHDVHRNVSFELSGEGVHTTGHAISSDGRWVAYAALRSRYGIYRRRTDGSAAEERLLDTPAHALVNGFNADATRVLWMDFASGSAILKSLDVATGESTAIGPGAEGAYSPDGRWIAYLDSPAGLVIKAADGAGKVYVAAGGSQVRWRGDSKELYYMGHDRKLMAVPLSVADGALEPGAPRALFQSRIVQPRLVLFQYDVTSDGERFLINSLPRNAAPLKLVVNWPRLGV